MIWIVALIQSRSAFSPSPLRPPEFPSFSDFDESDDEEETTCYSPTNLTEEDFDDAADSSTLPPCKKRIKLNVERGKLCCEPDLKMLWLKLGQVDDIDFYENWPEFPAAAHRRTDQQMVEIAIYLLLKLSWLNETPHQMSDASVTKAVIDYLVHTPTPAFRACRILFRLTT